MKRGSRWLQGEAPALSGRSCLHVPALDAGPRPLRARSRQGRPALRLGLRRRAVRGAQSACPGAGGSTPRTPPALRFSIPCPVCLLGQKGEEREEPDVILTAESVYQIHQFIGLFSLGSGSPQPGASGAGSAFLVGFEFPFSEFSPQYMGWVGRIF